MLLERIRFSTPDPGRAEGGRRAHDCAVRPERTRSWFFCGDGVAILRAYLHASIHWTEKHLPKVAPHRIAGRDVLHVTSWASLKTTEVPTAKWSELRYGLKGQLEDHDGEA